MKASDFDKAFDAGEDVSKAVDWSMARRPNDRPRRVNVDFPAWVVEGLDRQARHLGVTRQPLIKVWIAGGPQIPLDTRSSIAMSCNA